MTRIKISDITKYISWTKHVQHRLDPSTKIINLVHEYCASYADVICAYVISYESVSAGRELWLFYVLFVGPLPRVRPRNGILALLLGEPLRSEFIGEL